MPAFSFLVFFWLGGLFSFLIYRLPWRAPAWPSAVRVGLSILLGLCLSGCVVLLALFLFRAALEAGDRIRVDCDPAYPGVCLPPGPPDLDCQDIPISNFDVLWPDPHGLDADGDGVGCER
jgi:hypothetical protein